MLPALAVLAWALCAFVMWLADPIPVQGLRLAQFDQFQRWHPRPDRPVALRVVDVDEASLREHGQWPWPRTRMAALVGRLLEAGASVVALDILLAEPDRTSPAAMARLWQRTELDPLLAAMPDHEDLFARAIAGQPVVLGASMARAPAVPAGAAPPQAWRVVTRGPDARAWLPAFDAAVWPMPRLMGAAAGVGALNLSADADGVVRRVPMMLALPDALVPGLGAEALRVAAGARNHVLDTDAAGIRSLTAGAHQVPTGAAGDFWLHYARDATRHFIPAAQVLAGQLPPGSLRGHIVLVGSSAAGLMDQRTSPMGHLMPGVVAHATALEQVLSGQHLRRPGWTRGLEAVLLLAGVLAVGLVAVGAPLRAAALTLAAALALLAGAAWWAFTDQGLLLDAVNPALATACAFVLGIAGRYRATERRQRWLRAAFSRYISPNRVAHLLANPGLLHLGGQRQVCSFVFTDLAGFTRMMESADPAQAVAWLNEYLDGMLEVVFRHEGTLDRIVGDAIAVLFSAPMPQADHRQRALDCALDLHAFASGYAQRLRAAGVAWGDTRIGVHCGEVIVGNFGGQRMFDYRALGDAVNTAARLETANRHLGTHVCVSAAIAQGCTGVPMRSVGRLVLKGKTEPIEVATPQAALPPGCAPASDYQGAFDLLRRQGTQDGSGAMERFSALGQAWPDDPLVQLHLQRLAAGEKGDLIVLEAK